LDWQAGHFFASADDLAHGVTLTVAQVEKAVPARCQGQNVRLGQVADVNVIAHTRAVRRGIVRAENLAMRLLAKRDFEHVRDQVRLDAMMFAEAFAGAAATAGSLELQVSGMLVRV